MIGFSIKRSLQGQFKPHSSILQNFVNSDILFLGASRLHYGKSYPFSEAKNSKTEEKPKQQQQQQQEASSSDKKEQKEEQKGFSAEEVRNYFRDFNTFDKLGEAKDQWEMYRIRRQKKLVEKKMAREIREREKYEKMTDEERGQMETAISQEFKDSVDIIDEPDIFFHMYYTQSTFWDRVKVKIQFLKCRLFYAKEFAKKQEQYDKILLRLNYNRYCLNQSLPMLHRELQKWYERKIPDYYTKTKWELFKSMKPQLEREFGMKLDSINSQEGIPTEPTPETATDSTVKDPEEAAEEPDIEEMQQKFKLYNQFQTALAVVGEDQVFKPTVKNLQVNQEQAGLDRMKLLNNVGWNRTQTIKLFHDRDRTEYNNKTYRHEYFCVREEMNNFMKDKQDIDISGMSEKERLTMFSTASFDPKESFRRKWRLAWLNHQNKIGFGFAEGEEKTGVWFDLGVFENLGKSKVQIKDASSGIKETYDEQVSSNATSAYGGAAFLLTHSSKDNSMEKCLDFIRQYDKEFNQQDLEDYVRHTFERVYTSHLNGMLYEIEQICLEQAMGYFKAVWNVWTAQKARPKYQRIWGLEKPVFSSSEINSSNQPVFSFSIHCQTNHCLVDAKDGMTLKEGSDERVMRNGYQVVALFDPLEVNQQNSWKIISIAPIEKTLLLA